jgi:GNAT superfamily N-acetyltransferase
VAAASAAGIHFTSYAAYPQDDASLTRFRDLLWELHLDVPTLGELAKPTLEQVRTEYMDSPNWDPAGILIAVDTMRGGRWVGLARVTRQSTEVYYNTFTGVHRDYRGRGLAQAIKLMAVEYARSKGATTIRTHNDSRNAPMLAVNRKMGCCPEPGAFKLIRRLRD